jgi:hypothetical protein
VNLCIPRCECVHSLLHSSMVCEIDCSKRSSSFGLFGAKFLAGLSSKRQPGGEFLTVCCEARFVIQPGLPRSHSIVPLYVALTVAVPWPYGRGRWRFDSSMGRPSGPSSDGYL